MLNTIPTQKVDLGYVPRPFFVPFHTRYQRFACIVAHRRAGKTVAALMDTIHRALKNSTGNARYAFCGPTYSQIKDVVWLYLRQYAALLPNSRINEAELSVRLFNGATIRLYSLDSTAYDRMRGIFLDGCTIDEYADCDPRALDEVIRPALSDRQGWLTLIGTSKGRDAFWKAYKRAIKDPQWFALKLPASLTGAIIPAELDDMQRSMGVNEYARELECSFEAEGYDQLIPGWMVEEAIQREVPRDPAAPVVIGLDVARFGDDRTVLVVREGDRLVDGRIWKNRDLMVTAAETANIATRFKARMIYVDGIGVGGGVIDRLRHLGHTNVEDVNVARRASDDRKFANLRAECYLRLRDWLRDRGRIHPDFPFTKELEDDLTGVAYLYDQRGRMLIESKEELKKRGLPSPDTADALALTFATILPYSDIARIRGQTAPETYAAPIHDPFDTDF